MQVMESLAQHGGSADQIVVPVAKMKEFFDYVIDKITIAVQKSLDRAAIFAKKCDYMLVVGGFGGSPYLIARLRSAFSKKVMKGIISPGVPSQAVLKGMN